MTTGAELIAAERERQVHDEGWTPEHDDEHDRGQLVEAAIQYARHDLPGERRYEWDEQPIGFPWNDGWNPGSQIRNLVKAGALIAAEIDRLQRQSSKGPLRVP